MADAPWPDADAAADLHRRLAAGDPLAPADFAAAVLDPLVAHLRATRPRSDLHHVLQAAEDAILSASTTRPCSPPPAATWRRSSAWPPAAT